MSPRGRGGVGPRRAGPDRDPQAAGTDSAAPNVPNVRVAEADLAQLVAAECPLDRPVACSWIRRGATHTYLVEAPAGRHVLRLYLNHKDWIAGPDDFRFELELLRFARSGGVPVAAPVARRDGELRGAVGTGAGTRSCALFEFAHGAAEGPLTQEQAAALGRALARFHGAADDFRPSRAAYGRYHLDLRYLLDQPVALLDSFLREHGRGGLARYGRRLAALRAQAQELPKAPGLYGVVHGDPHRSNVAAAAGGRVTLFDFDHGGFGRRAYDLAVGSAPQATREACVRGYEEVRPLRPPERALLPAFRTLNAVWDVGTVLPMRAAWGAEEEIGAEFAENAERRFARILGDRRAT